MDHSLWNPNQLRNHGVKVYDCPKQFDQDSPFMLELQNDEGETFEIPLELNGIIEGIATHYPTEDELENCRRFTYTSDADWDPYSADFLANELAAQMHDKRRIAAFRTIRTIT